MLLPLLLSSVVAGDDFTTSNGASYCTGISRFAEGAEHTGSQGYASPVTELQSGRVCAEKHTEVEALAGDVTGTSTTVRAFPRMGPGFNAPSALIVVVNAQADARKTLQLSR